MIHTINTEQISLFISNILIFATVQTTLQRLLLSKKTLYCKIIETDEKLI